MVTNLIFLLIKSSFNPTPVIYHSTDLGTMDSMYRFTVPGNGVSMIKVTAKKTKLKEVFEAEYSWINNCNLTSKSAMVPDQAKVRVDTFQMLPAGCQMWIKLKLT